MAEKTDKAEKTEKSDKAVKSAKPVKKKNEDAKPNPIKQLIDFLGDVRRELKKVSWPTRADTMASTWVIITVTFVISIYLFFCDSILQFLMSLAFA